MAPRIGHIYKHDAFYLDTEDGELKSKYFLVLATPSRGDIVARLLTSRHAEVRPQSPRCYHGDPYPGFYLGVLSDALSSRSWLDLRPLEDFDLPDFVGSLRCGKVHQVMALPVELLRPALACAAGADDTTGHQERLIRDTLSSLSA